MEGNATGKPFKMKGHTLPGINQRSDTNLPDGRPASAALQYKSPAKEVDFNDPKVRANYEKFKDNPEYKKALATKMGGETTFTTGDEGAKSETIKSAVTYASPAKDTSPHTGMNPPHTEENHPKKYLAKKGTVRKKTDDSEKPTGKMMATMTKKKK